MQTLRHPGPVATERACVLPCRARPQVLDLPPGQPLGLAVPEAAAAAGVTAGWFELAETPMARLDYLRPGPDPSGRHAAWYDGPHAAGAARLIRLGLHLGRRDGAAFLHGHGLWQLAGGTLAAGHVLPDSAVPASAAKAIGWALEGAQLVASPDPETRFTLFRPVATCSVPEPDALLLTLRPNQDLGTALVRIAADHGIETARLHGLGSLVAPRFAEGGGDDSFATEILLAEARLHNRCADILALVAGFDGSYRSGRLMPGACAVCVTCEILLRMGG